MSMTSRFDADIPVWLHFSLNSFWKHRSTIGQILGGTIIGAGLLAFYWFHLRPSDLERADRDLKKAWAGIISFEEEAAQQLADAEEHKKNAAKYQKVVDDDKDHTDKVRLEWYKASAQAHRQLHQATLTRRNHLIHLAALHRRQVAEAACEILRAKDARDRGTPYPVAPRVQELLAPILAAR